MSAVCSRHTSPSTDCCDVAARHPRGAITAGAGSRRPVVPPAAPAASGNSHRPPRRAGGSGPAARRVPSPARNCATPNASRTACSARPVGYDPTTGRCRRSRVRARADERGGTWNQMRERAEHRWPGPGAATTERRSGIPPRIVPVGRRGVDRPRWVCRPAGHRPPSAGLPVVVPLRIVSALIGRVSASRNIVPDIDCSADPGVSPASPS